MKLKYNIETNKSKLPLAIRQILFLSNIEKAISKRENKKYSEVLKEDAMSNQEKLEKLEREWSI